jgi:hypothetical protein
MHVFLIQLSLITCNKVFFKSKFFNSKAAMHSVPLKQPTGAKERMTYFCRTPSPLYKHAFFTPHSALIMKVNCKDVHEM